MALSLYDKTIIDTYEYQIYNLWFESIVKDLPTHYYLYLTSTPERCIEKNRNRNLSKKTEFRIIENTNRYLFEIYGFY